jgi:hypothetical protein
MSQTSLIDFKIASEVTSEGGKDLKKKEKKKAKS